MYYLCCWKSMLLAFYLTQRMFWRLEIIIFYCEKIIEDDNIYSRNHIMHTIPKTTSITITKTYEIPDCKQQ